jgi:uncharacterized protein DUF4384
MLCRTAAAWRRRLRVTGLAAAAAIALVACGVVGRDALTDAQQAIADLRLGGSSLSLQAAVAGDRAAARVGGPLALSLQVNQPAYVAVLRVMPSGATTLVFPNRQQPTAKLAANSPVHMPAAGISLSIMPDKPGVVLFEVVASTDASSWLFHRQPTDGAEFVELGSSTRAIAKLAATSLKGGYGAETAATQLIVRVTDD